MRETHGGSRRFLPSLPLLVLVVMQTGCMAAPYPGQVYSSKSASITVTGAGLQPSSTITVEAYNFGTTRWDVVANTTSAASSFEYSGAKLYYFTLPIVLGGDYWLDGVIDPKGARARIRTRENGTFVISMVKGFSACAEQYESFFDILGNCASEDSPNVDVFTPGYSEPNIWGVFRIARHASVPLTGNEADRILEDASVVMQHNDGSGDVACPFSFFRSGNLTTFVTSGGVIDTERDYNAVLAIDAEVKVVDEINWCDGISPMTIGCAPVGGGSFIVERITENREGILWAHEYGHNRGLLHRPPNSVNAVMNSFITSTARRLSSSECTSYY